MKALILYDDFVIAAMANAALHRSAQNDNFTVQWNISPWRMDMLKFTRTAQEALAEAIDSHLIVLASNNIKLLPLWLQGWLELWVKNRRIEEAALAIFCLEKAASSSSLSALDLPQFAKRHGLSVFFHDRHAARDGSYFPLGSAIKHELGVLQPTQPAIHVQSQHPFRQWGINE
jgi:hypothetical protein